MASKNRNIGSISSGTMRSEDLLPCFIATARSLRLTRAQRTKVCEIDRLSQRRDYYDGECASEDLDTLFSILDQHAPQYFYFGSHQGDGACFGWWLPEDWEQQLEDDGGLRVTDQSEIPADHVGPVVAVSDHGNLTMYWRGANHRLYEWWSIV